MCLNGGERGVDVKILNQRTHYTAVEAYDPDTTLVLERVAFGAFQPRSVFATHLRVGGLAFAALYDTTFPLDAETEINIANGSVFAAQPESLKLVDSSAGSVQPLAELPGNVTFLGADDAALRQIQAVRTPACSAARSLLATSTGLFSCHPTARCCCRPR